MVAAFLDIATNFASGKEAVGAIFPNNDAKGKRRDEALGASAPHLPKKKKKGHQGKQEVLEADLVMAADCKNPRGPARGSGLFDDILKKSCPYHQGPVKHTLEECTMLRHYYARLEPPPTRPRGGTPAIGTTTRTMGSPRCTTPS